MDIRNLLAKKTAQKVSEFLLSSLSTSATGGGYLFALPASCVAECIELDQLRLLPL
jgi:hypothetical protein